MRPGENGYGYGDIKDNDPGDAGPGLNIISWPKGEVAHATSANST